MGVLAYVGLGSNLGDRESLITKALEALRPRRVSRVLETEPWGLREQPRFLNAVAELQTDLSAQALLARLRDVEDRLGRVRAQRWGPRTMDLDLLLYGDVALESDALSIPHPRLAGRRFVLEGLAELCPEHRVPGLERTVRELLEDLP